MMWLTVTGALPRPGPAVMCLYMAVAAHAMTFFNTANVVTGVHNFPSYSGTIVGIMKVRWQSSAFLFFFFFLLKLLFIFDVNGDSFFHSSEGM